MPFAGVSSVAVRSEMKHGSSQRHVVLTLNRRYARVDDQESINYQTMTPDTFVSTFLVRNGEQPPWRCSNREVSPRGMLPAQRCF